MEDDKTRLPAEKVPTLALNDPEPAPRGLSAGSKNTKMVSSTQPPDAMKIHNCRRTVLQEAPARSQ